VIGGLVVALVLAACSTGGQAAPSQSATLAATPSPAMTPVAAATSSLAATSAPTATPTTPAATPTPGQAGFSATGSMAVARGYDSATALADGRVLIAGGRNDSARLASAELYDPATGKFSPTGSMAHARDSHTATLLSDGRVLIVGGLGAGTSLAFLASAEVYDPASDSFSPAGTMAVGRAQHTATLLADGGVLIAGGVNDSGPFASADLWRP
jgi:hypothetical protein